jgi:hypothetical protein
MIENYSDADYLRLLAHWFEQLPAHHPDATITEIEVYENLLRISNNIERYEKMTGVKFHGP